MSKTDTTPFDAAFRRALLQLVQQELQQANAPGATVALFVDGSPLLQSAVGFCDIARTTSLDANARFYLYSITKSFTAIAVLQLVAREQLALEDAIQTYLPQLPLAAPVTLRQLLNHTGGLPDYGGMQAYHKAVKETPHNPWTAAQFLQRTLANGFAFAPGEGWGYSNIGYLVLKMLIEKVTSRSWREVLHQQIIAPLKLQQTVVAQTVDDAATLTPGYSTFFSTSDSPQDIRPTYHPGWVSHGVLISTAPEVARVFDALFAGHLLPPELLDAMCEPVPVPVQHPLFRQPAYGLGVMIDTASAHGPIVGHGGGGPGYSTAALCFPDVASHRLTIVALVNHDQSEGAFNIAFQLGITTARHLQGDG